MTVFKAFFKVLNASKAPIIMYTVILIFFGGFNLKSNDKSTNFVASKPDILIINHDSEEGITSSLIEYITRNSNIVEIKDNENAINDALFYRDVNYIIYIPTNFRKDLLNGKNPQIEVKSTGDYQSSLAEMMLEKYLKLANIYIDTYHDEEKIIESINNTLKNETEIMTTSNLDTTSLDQMSAYYNFANYSILAGCVYVICLILSSFKDDKISKRTIISSMNYKKYNRKLLLSNSLFAIVMWLFYVLLSFILIGNAMFTIRGLMYMINSFIFTICALAIAFLIANIVNNKNAINGIINVVALGSSFLCGAFVPMEWLPEQVLTIAHILPSYWYIKTNEVLKVTEVFNIDTLKSILVNMFVIIIFTILFIIITNIISSKKRKIA